MLNGYMPSGVVQQLCAHALADYKCGIRGIASVHKAVITGVYSRNLLVCMHSILACSEVSGCSSILGISGGKKVMGLATMRLGGVEGWPHGTAWLRCFKCTQGTYEF